MTDFFDLVGEALIKDRLMFGGLVHIVGGLVKASLSVMKSKLKYLQVLKE